LAFPRSDVYRGPKVHAWELRCCIRDPDGYLIEVGQKRRLPPSRWNSTGDSLRWTAL
jgi:hypothetical protein